jgi:predicted ATPase
MPHLKKLHLMANSYPDTDQYPFNLPLLRETGEIDFPGPLTFFAGDNGTGKSTLLRAICRGSGIHIWEGERRGRYRKSPFENALHHFLGLEWEDGFVPGSFFSSDIFRFWAEALDEFALSDPGMLNYFGGSSLMSQSHGQSMLSFFRSRYSRKGLYLLDEPETALSPRSQIELIRILEEAAARGDAQFIVATHSPILLACPGAVIYNFDDLPLKPVPYEETEYFKVYRDFLFDRGKYLELEPGARSQEPGGKGRSSKSGKE